VTPTAGLDRELVDAARVLSALGLVTAYGHVSSRNGTTITITPAADLATVTEPELIEVPLAAAALPRALPPRRGRISPCTGHARMPPRSLGHSLPVPLPWRR
jgi:hypothetical protein